MNTRKLKKIDTKIDSNDPFASCKFERRKYAESLTKIIQAYPSGFVMSINNEWGMGKTTFIKMWFEYLKKEEIKAIYFNAWENDYESSPLVSILSELNEEFKLTTSSTTNKILEYGSSIAKNILPELIKQLTSTYVGINTNEIIEKLSESGAEIFKKEIELYRNKKQNIIKFKEELTARILENSINNQPIVFIIDELDRCKPTYAVELLENIKHLFSVDEITFVLSIDKNQLSNSVKGYFGSDRIDSEDYLRRFIDLEFSLPSPNIKNYIDHLYDYYKLGDILEHKTRTQYHSTKYDNEIFKKTSKIFLENCTLRQIEKFFISARISLYSFSEKNYIFPHLFSFLVYLKTFKSEIFSRIEKMNYTRQELSDVFFSIIENIKIVENNNLIARTEAMLLVAYNNYDETNSISLTSVTDDNKIICAVESKSSKLFKYNIETEIESILVSYNRINLQFILNKIRLTDNLEL